MNEYSGSIFINKSTCLMVINNQSIITKSDLVALCQMHNRSARPLVCLVVWLFTAMFYWCLQRVARLSLP